MSRRRWIAPLLVLALVIAALAWWRGERSGPRRAGAPVDAVDERLPPGGDPRAAPTAGLAGQVRDRAGAPVVGATVCVTADGPGLDEVTRRAVRCVDTATGGRYQLDALVPGTYAVHASAPGLAPVRWRGPDGEVALALASGARRDGVDLILARPAALISGRVLDVGGGPVVGAAVAATRRDRGRGGRFHLRTTGGFAVTDGDGRFTLAAAPGEVVVRARADGYADGSLDAVAPTSELVVTLTPASAIEGLVVDREQRPVVGALVDLSELGGDGPQARSDGAGRFRLAPVAPGRYRPRAVSADGLGLASHDVVLAFGHTVDDVHITLVPTGAVVGQVMIEGATPTPCPAAEVSLTGPLDAIVRNAVADGEGRVELFGVPAGAYAVGVACRTGRAIEQPIVVVVGRETVTARWTVAPGATIRGRVTASDGSAVSDATVSVEPRMRPPRVVNVDRDGRYVVIGLEPGSIQVTASAPGFAGATPIAVELSETEERVVDLTLTAGGEIRGTVVDADGRPRANHVVYAHHDSGARVETHTTHDGTFRLVDVAVGAWSVVAEDGIDEMFGGTGPGPRAQARATVAVGAVATVALVVAVGSGQITGRVVDDQGAPVGDAWVAAAPGSGLDGGLFGTAGNRAKAGLGGRPVLTSVDGRFSIGGLAPGRYDLFVQRPGGGAAELSGVEVGAELAIVLELSGAIVGTVTTEPAGPPPAWFTVTYAVVGEDSWDTETFLATDAFRLPDLPAGRYRLSVDTPSQVGTATVEVSPGATATVAIALVSTPGASGRVIELGTGAPIAGLIVMASAIEGLPGATVSSEPSGADGRFFVPRVPRGVVELFVYGTAGGPYRNASAFVDVTGAGDVAVGDIEVPRSRVPRGQRAGTVGVTWRPSEVDDPRQARLEAIAVEPDSPAAAAGLRVGDRLVVIDGVPVTGRIAVAWSLVLVPPGTTVRVTLERGVDLALTAVP
jgi:hypothetical protein